MSTQIRIRIEGQEDTVRNISSFNEEKTSELREIIKEFSKKVGTESRKIVPVSPPNRKKSHGSPGDLKKSIRAKYYFNGLGAMIAPMKPKGSHRFIIELGTKQRKNKKGQNRGKVSPHPFMEPTATKYESTYNQKIKQVFDEDTIV